MQMYPDDKVIRPHAKPVEKELVFVTLGDQTTLPQDNT